MPQENDWEARFLQLAAFFANWSKAPRTRVGAVAVGPDKELLSMGFDGLPRGVVDDPARMEKPAKFLYTSHAEENLVAHAARIGVSLKGATIYVTHQPCSCCARMLIQAGVKRVVWDAAGKTSMPDEEFAVALELFEEAGVLRKARVL